MSLDVIARHKGNSDIADGFLEIIRQLGIWIESLSGTNPDAGFDSFAASNYNHGNRSEQADLMEEVILRLQEINSLGPGGGGSSADNKIRVDAADTVSKTWDQLFASTNEIAWGKVAGDETTGKQVRLIAQMCFTAGQKAYIGGIPENFDVYRPKLSVVAEDPQTAVLIQCSDGSEFAFDNKGYLRHTGGIFLIESLDNGVQLRNGSGKDLILTDNKLFASIIRNSTHATAAAVQADGTINAEEVVALTNGTLVKKL